MHRRKWSSAVGLVGVTAVLLGALPTGATAAPQRPEATPLPGEPLPDEYAHVDNRPGSAAPTARQRGLVAGGVTTRWNRLGTPACVVRTRGALATGFAKDPEKAARQYLRGNLGLFSLAPGRPTPSRRSRRPGSARAPSC